MDSSDESFLFTPASSDSSDMELENEKNGSEPESYSDKAYKKKLQNKLLNTTQEEKGKSNKRKRKLVIENGEDNEYQADKSIKSEPNSDFDTPVKKKRKRHDTSKNIENHHESYEEAEDYLNLRVKQEQISFAEPIPIKSKKKKKYKEETDSIHNNDLELEVKEDIIQENILNHVSPSRNGNYDDSYISEEDTSRKKKKKKKRNKTSESHDSIVDEFEDSKSKKQINTDNSNEEKYKIDHNNDNSTSLNITTNNFSENHTDSDHNETLLNNTTTIKKKKTSIKTSRISDRLRFEDDSVDYELKDKVLNDNISKKLKNFQNANPHLTPLQSNAHNDTVIAEDDEVWIVRGPHELSIDDFENVNLSLLPKSKIKLNGKSYDSVINDSVNSATIVSYNNKEKCVRNVPIIGVINLHKRIPKVHIPYEEVIMQNQDSFIPLPDTKCRHPLFGINYKKATKIPATIVHRLNTEEVAYDIDDYVSKKKKKKKKKEKVEVESEIEEKVNLEALEATSSSKKKRKRKHDEGDSVRKKAKRIKQDPDCAESWESEQAIEKKLFSF